MKFKSFVKLGFFHESGLFFALFPDDRILLLPDFNGFPDWMRKLFESNDWFHMYNLISVITWMTMTCCLKLPLYINWISYQILHTRGKHKQALSVRRAECTWWSLRSSRELRKTALFWPSKMRSVAFKFALLTLSHLTDEGARIAKLTLSERVKNPLLTLQRASCSVIGRFWSS